VSAPKNNILLAKPKSSTVQLGTVGGHPAHGLDVVRLGQLKPLRQKNRYAFPESRGHRRACPAWFHVLGLQTGFLFDHRLLKSVAHGDIIP